MTAPHLVRAGVTPAHLANIARRLRIRQRALEASPYADDDTFNAQATADLAALLRLVETLEEELASLRAAVVPRPLIEDVIEAIEGQHPHTARPKLRTHRHRRRSMVRGFLHQVRDSFNDHFRS